MNYNHGKPANRDNLQNFIGFIEKIYLIEIQFPNYSFTSWNTLSAFDENDIINARKIVRMVSKQLNFF